MPDKQGADTPFIVCIRKDGDHNEVAGVKSIICHLPRLFVKTATERNYKPSLGVFLQYHGHREGVRRPYHDCKC